MPKTPSKSEVGCEALFHLLGCEADDKALAKTLKELGLKKPLELDPDDEAPSVTVAGMTLEFEPPEMKFVSLLLTLDGPPRKQYTGGLPKGLRKTYSRELVRDWVGKPLKKTPTWDAWKMPKKRVMVITYTPEKMGFVSVRFALKL